MKKTLLIAALLFTIGMSFSSCRETEKQSNDKVIIIEKDGNDVPTKKREGALEKAAKAIDNAAKEVKEAGKAVDSAAKEVVGDDN